MLDGEVKSYTVSHTQSGAEINGEIALSGIACEINVDNSVGYTPIKATVPFVANVNINCQIPENSRIECSVSVSSVEGLMDADDVHLKIALKIKSRLECVSETVCLVACNVSADEYLASETATPSHITVYYPTPSDTLFSVAKRFHSTPEKIACDNMLTESVSATDSTDSLSGVKRLVIR
jgi:hypothetical protein